MESQEWESVFQFVNEPIDASVFAPDKPISGKTPLAASRPPSQVPTPPVSTPRNPCAPSLLMYSTLVAPHRPHHRPPQDSNQGSPSEVIPDIDSVVSVSTTFFPGANLNLLPPDLILLSSDAVFFYVHCNQLLSASENGFRGLLPFKSSKGPHLALKALGLSHDLGQVVPMAESSSTVNVLLHVIYNMSPSHYSPTLETLCAAVDALASYGVPVARHCTATTPIYALILAHAPIAPVDVYTLAASHDMYDLAVPASAHLLGFSLANLSDEHAARMGPLYLKRLFFLHLGRIEALKRLLLPPPHPHPPTAECDFTEQKKLTRAWALASAYLAWDVRPDLSMSSMEAALCPLGEHLSCDVCKKNLTDRVKQLVMQWSVVKRTI
ncbi:hypothetical protein C8Q72DRAFT_311860 [Fomitopsis betulina]|nr:hypothetical protein C8Q72DRAFT_311860 [Fomitopsis betulina]